MRIIILLLVIIGTQSCRANSDKVSFVIMGDTPYTKIFDHNKYRGDYELALVEKVYPRLINPEKHLFLIHLGDIKGGAEECSDNEIKKYLKIAGNVYPEHTIYTPGDNEWTDCDRDSAGGHSQVDRMKFLRTNLDLIEPSETVKTKFKIISQKGQAENKIWVVGDVLFGSIHHVGSNNGRDEILKDDKKVAIAEIEKREELNAFWMKQIFEKAREKKAVVLSFHSDLFREKDKHNAHKTFREMIQSFAAEFKKPVLIMHGESSAYCLDQPFSLKNIWRINGPGDVRVSDMVEVEIDLTLKNPFSAKGLLVQMDLPEKCIY